MDSFTLQITNEVLPQPFKNKIVPSNTSQGSNKIVIRSNINTIDEISKWVKEFGNNSATQWNVRSSNPHGISIVCSKKFICRHSSFMKVKNNNNKRGISTNTDCRASILVQIKKNTKNVRYKDPYAREGLFGIIVMEIKHNHSLKTAETLRFPSADDSDSSIRNNFIEYFNDGMGIAESQKHHQSKLELLSDDFEKDLANGSLNPTLRTIKWWHDQWIVLNVGPRTEEGLIKKLIEKQQIYKEHGSTLMFNKNPFAIVIITPLMRRAHSLFSSNNIVFMNSTSAGDSENHRITFLLTTCAAGAVPLAIIISIGQPYECYCAGFQIIKKAIPNCFGGQGYPLIFVTDQSTAEINAIRNVWPNSKTLLCIFHVLRAVWLWLWDQKHNILKDDRQTLMKDFQMILYTTSAEDAEGAFTRALKYSKYENWTKYLEEFWKFKEEWCLAFRKHLTSGHNTNNNYSDITVRIFKDNVLCRVKAYNVIALVDLTCTALEKYYLNRLREFSNGRNSSARLFLQTLIGRTVYLKKEEITQSSLFEYLVPSQKNVGEMYFVNIHDGFCSCPSGQLGRFCKHQCAIFNFFDVLSQNFPPVTVDDKYEIAKLALGECAPPRSFYEPFMPSQQSSSSPANNFEVKIECLPTEFDVPILTDAVICASNNKFECDNTDDQIRNLCDSLIKNHEKYGSSRSGIASLKKCLAKITSKGQWETFLHTAGNSIPSRKRPGAAIKVQPISIARRKPKFTKRKRLPSGRPASKEKVAEKRPRNLT